MNLWIILFTIITGTGDVSYEAVAVASLDKSGCSTRGIMLEPSVTARHPDAQIFWDCTKYEVRP